MRVDTTRILTVLAAVVLLGAVAARPAGAADKHVPGFVDGDQFLRIAGEDNLQVEVSLHGSLLRAILRGADPELQQMLGGLESIHAVILGLDGADRAEAARKAVRDTQSKLTAKGWERLATVREEGSEINVLVLNDEEAIQGLVVMIVDHDENQIVFANIAGHIDFAALKGLQESFGLPGLDRIKIPDR